MPKRTTKSTGPLPLTTAYKGEKGKRFGVDKLGRSIEISKAEYTKIDRAHKARLKERKKKQ